MNNYDAWLTNAPRDDSPPCRNCRHAYDDHCTMTTPLDGSEPYFDDACRECDCEMYEAQEPPERDPDEAYERRREAHYS